LARGFSEERWRTILELSEELAPLPVHERSAYLIAAGVGPEISVEVLELAAEFQEETPQAPSPDERLGTRVGRFLITSLLGSGGMGNVYAAHDTELNRLVALKFLRPEMLGYDAGYQRFIQEAQTASLVKPSKHRHDPRDCSNRLRDRHRDGTGGGRVAPRSLLRKA